MRFVPARRNAHVELFFDLGDPYSYLAVERVERAFDSVTWTPASSAGLRAGRQSDQLVEARAHKLRLPLVWPERFPSPVVRAMRVAALAAERGRGAEFALAAGRLAFAGGFHLDDPEILAEAAAAAGLEPAAVTQAAADRDRDRAIESVTQRLIAAGADRLPALGVDGRLFWGEDRIPEAAVAARWAAAADV